MSKRARRTDANQPEVVKALRAIGCSVLLLHEVGDGCPDLAVGYRGHNWFIEVKDGNKPPSKRKLTEDEQAWHEARRGQVATVKSADEAVALVSGYDCPCQFPPF